MDAPTHQQLARGYINSEHTSNVTLFFPPKNLPTPWPLAVASILVSLMICCYAFSLYIATMKSISRAARGHPKPEIAGGAELTTLNPELHDVHDDDGYVTDESGSESKSVRRVDVEPRSEASWTRSRKIVAAVVAYSFFRSVVAIWVSVQGLIDKHTTAAAPTSLLLVVISISLVTSAVRLSPLLRGVTTISIVLIFACFLVEIFTSSFRISPYPIYAQMEMHGGTCPIFASNCIAQTKHWNVTGCGNYTRSPEVLGKEPSEPFYNPYRSIGHFSGTSVNPIGKSDSAQPIIDMFLLFFLFFEVSETLRYFRNKATYNRHRLEEPIVTLRGALYSLLFLLPTIGIILAVVLSFVSIGSHMAQALGTHHGTFMDSFGPVVPTNFTRDSHGVIISVDYEGNSTSWTDCFTITAPSSPSGYWNEWVTQNKYSLYRIPAGL